MRIAQQLVASRAQTTSGTNTKRYITIHETANTGRGANAKAHANLQTNGNSRSASWHWQVDDNQAIQSFPHDVRCWHAGNSQGNNESIGVEICVNSDGDYAKAVDNAAKLVAKISEDEGIPIANIVQHNRWSGKNCPTLLRNGSKGVTWSDFITKVKREGSVSIANVDNSKPSDWAKASWDKAIKAGVMNDGQGPKDVLTREQLAVILDRLGMFK